MNSKNKKVLNSLYDDLYNKNVKLLIALVEARYEKFPPTIFNEIRSFNDHISRCYSEDIKIKEKLIEKELSCAEGHLLRIIADCYKLLIISYKDSIKNFEKKTKNLDLIQIDSGKFYAKYVRLYQKGFTTETDAKKSESFNKEKSYSLYQKSFLLYYELDKYITANMPKISRAKRKKRLFSFIGTILWFLAIFFGIIIKEIISEYSIVLTLKKFFLSFFLKNKI